MELNIIGRDGREKTYDSSLKRHIDTQDLQDYEIILGRFDGDEGDEGLYPCPAGGDFNQTGFHPPTCFCVSPKLHLDALNKLKRLKEEDPDAYSKLILRYNWDGDKLDYNIDCWLQWFNREDSSLDEESSVDESAVQRARPVESIAVAVAVEMGASDASLDDESPVDESMEGVALAATKGSADGSTFRSPQPLKEASMTATASTPTTDNSSCFSSPLLTITRFAPLFATTRQAQKGLRCKRR